MSNKQITVRDVVEQNPLLHNFDYKWRDSDSFKSLEEALNEVGYDFKREEDRKDQDEYNDIKAYYNVEVMQL
jgi:hypothetical protein